MSYCRFENTYKDLQDCLEWLQDNDIKDLSVSEQQYALRLIKMCKEIAEDFSQD